MVRKNHKTGHIDVWPHAEQTLTVTPANPYARITASKAVADLSAILSDLSPDLSNGGAPSGNLPTGGDDSAMHSKAVIDAARLAARLEILKRT
jgi:hypothetical protein